jgi:hypothetical protein
MVVNYKVFSDEGLSQELVFASLQKLAKVSISISMIKAW